MQNRFYLLSAMLLPFVVPFVELPVEIVGDAPVLAVMLDEFVVGAVAPVNEGISFLDLLPILYLIVCAVLLLRMLIGIVSILFLFRQARVIDFDGKKIYVTPRQVNPFSVFKRILVTEQSLLDQDSLRRIVLHENTHINQHHGIDSLVAECICALFWVNPFFWLLKKELKSTHEYLADEKVIERSSDLAKYFMLMFDNIVGKDVGFANNFNQSLNLKRMKMMKKKRSPRFARILSITAMPALLVVALFFSGQLVDGSTTMQDDNEINEVVVVGYGQGKKTGESPKIENTTANKNIDAPNEVDGKIYQFVVGEMPQYPGGTDALMKYLRLNVRYPEVSREKKEQGKVVVSFIITKSGEVANVGIRDGVTEALNNEAIRVVEEMPNWTPAKHKGEVVNVAYLLPIKFHFK